MVQVVEGYRGSTLLKRPNTPIQWTPHMVEEYLKCKNSIEYFTEKYMKIVSKDHGLVPFILYDYQREIISTIDANRFTVVECARQAGKTASLTAYVLHYILFHEHKVVAIVANKGDTARKILSSIQFAYERLPLWLQQGIIEWNKGSLELENGCKIVAAATTADNLRGWSIDILFVDEAAHIENWEAFWTSIRPTISSGKSTKVVLVSTVNGMNHFHQITQGARKKGTPEWNGWQLISVKWDQVPGRDEAWKEEELRSNNYNYDLFAQEYENEYLGSSGTLIAGWKLKELIAQDTVNPIFAEYNIFQYKEPKPDRRYLLVADVSEGKGLDYSAFQVIDISEMPYEQVCCFRDNQIVPGDFAEIINRVGRAYNEAFLLVEINSIGQQVSEILFNDYEYENMLHTENKGRLGKRVIVSFGIQPGSERGIRTTTPVKRIGCSMLKILIEQNQLIIHDYNTIAELTWFIKDKNTYNAEKGKNDDLVSSLFLFAWLSDQPFFKEVSEIQTLLKIRERTTEQYQSLGGPLVVSTNGVDDKPEFQKRGNDYWLESAELKDYSKLL